MVFLTKILIVISTGIGSSEVKRLICFVGIPNAFISSIIVWDMALTFYVLATKVVICIVRLLYNNSFLKIVFVALEVFLNYSKLYCEANVGCDCFSLILLQIFYWRLETL